MFGFLRKTFKASVSFPPPWTETIHSRVPYVKSLTEMEIHRLFELVGEFLRQKTLEGCGGQEMTDEIRVVVAAQACILLLGGSRRVFPGLRSVLVYPETFVAPVVERDGDWLVTETDEARSGEFWSHGAVILAWDDVQFSLARPNDGYNVVFHEFAHWFDHETGASEGMENELQSDAFHRVIRREYLRLRKADRLRRKSLLDPYGATSPAEFFAVATEFFFERPMDLKTRHPALYAQLKAFYRQDTAQRAFRYRSMRSDHKPDGSGEATEGGL